MEDQETEKGKVSDLSLKMERPKAGSPLWMLILKYLIGPWILHFPSWHWSDTLHIPISPGNVSWGQEAATSGSSFPLHGLPISLTLLPQIHHSDIAVIHILFFVLYLGEARGAQVG